jgi:hypothetical protein
MKKNILFLFSFIFFLTPFAITNAQTQSKTSGINVAEKYDPLYWLEGTFEHSRTESIPSDVEISAKIDNAYAKGWRGVTYWGADRAGAKMNYYFKSPFLEKQDWAVFKRDGLSSIVKAAHKKGLKVMINIEGCNPYHWTENKWTPETIKAVAEDIAATGC